MRLNTVIFSNAVAKYNEGKILSVENLRRIADADYGDAIKMLADYGYTDGDGLSVDAFIAKEVNALNAYILDDTPNDFLARVLINPYFYSNVKAVVKNKYYPFDVDAVLYDVAETDEIKDAVSSGDYGAIRPFVADALSEIDGLVLKNGNASPADIDLCLTKAMCADSLYNAKKSKSALMKKYVTAKIDLSNLLTLLRSSALGMSVSVQFIDGGSISVERLTAAEKKPISEIVAEFSDTDYFDALCFAEKSLARFETACDDYLYTLCDRASDNMLSIAPILAYVLKKQIELSTVKTVLVCLKTNARELIYERLRGMGDI